MEKKSWRERFKDTIIVGGVVFALLGAGGTAAIASGTVTWVGTADYQETLAILDDIKDEGEARIGERDSAKQTIVQRDSTITSKNSQISGLETNLSTTQGELTSTKNTLTTTQNTLTTTQSNLSTAEGKLGQAQKDVQALKTKSAEVLSVLKNN